MLSSTRFSHPARFSSTWLPLLTSAAGLLLSPITAHAANLSFTFHDTVGDPRDKTDVVEIYFQFDNQTGNFDVKVTTDAANPFNGSHLLYLSVFNPDVGTNDPSKSLFGISRFGFFAASPTTTLSRAGNTPVLTHWNFGNRVASYDVLGTPSNQTGFYSVLGGNTASFTNADQILDQAVIVAVPETASWFLAIVASILVLLSTARCRNRGQGQLANRS